MTEKANTPDSYFIIINFYCGIASISGVKVFN